LTKSGGISGSIPYIPFRLYFTENFYQTFTELLIDSQFVFGEICGFFPDVYRGGKVGEVYVSSWFLDGTFKVSFSADTGHTFRHVYVEKKYCYEDALPIFMSDREPGIFYIARFYEIEDFNPWGWHKKVCVEYYRDYGETLVATYCHDITRDFGKTCEAVNDLAAEKCGENCIFLSWSEPESSLPVVEYHVYRMGEGRKEKENSHPMNWRGGHEADGVVKNTEYELVGSTKDTYYLDKNLPVGEYEYYVVAHYEMGCVADSSNHVSAEVELGVKGVKELEEVKVYPNPTSGELQVSGFGFRILGVEVLDVYGRNVGTNLRVCPDTDGVIFNISHLQAGIYFLRITSEKDFLTKKIIKY
jgi:hypothetical protein